MSDTIKIVQLQDSTGENLYPEVKGDQVYSIGTGLNLIQQLEKYRAEMAKYRYGIGALFFSSKPIDLNARFPGTVWEQVSGGKILVGAGTGTDSKSVANTFIPDSSSNPAGTFTTTLTVSTMPSHNHQMYKSASSSGRDGYDYGRTGNTYSSCNWVGGSGTHNNMMQSQVTYIYKRIS